MDRHKYNKKFKGRNNPKNRKYTEESETTLHTNLYPDEL